MAYPTYTAKMPAKLLKFFDDRKREAIESDRYTEIPTLKQFAQSVGVGDRTVQQWAQDNEEFASAKVIALAIQLQFLEARVGYPTSKYSSEFPAMLVDHFLEIRARGTTLLPTIESFAVKVGASRQSLYRWSSAHPEFKTALEYCKTVQHEWLLKHSAVGDVPQKMIVFLLKCIHGVAEPVPQLPVPQLPVPQLPVPQLPVPQLPVPQLPVPQLPVPQLPANEPPVLPPPTD